MLNHTKSDTPLTDAALDSVSHKTVWKVCRQLERDRAALRAALLGLIPLIESTFPKQQGVWLEEARAILSQTRREGE